MEDQVEKQEKVQYEVDAQTHFAVTLQEFDKKIAELQYQKTAFIYNTTMARIKDQHEEKKIREQIAAKNQNNK